jgi:hypothetical protein
MAEKASRRVKTLNSFIKWAAQFDDGQYLFRGVSKNSYEIEASAYRRLPEAQRNNPARLLRINQDLIEKARLLGHDQKNGQRLSDLELLAELQHFGAATCLIDFTRNALVALWMACQQSTSGATNGKVFAVRSDDSARFETITPKLVTAEDIDYFFKEDEQRGYPLYQWQPKYQNNRIIAQQSVFIFGGAQVETEAHCIILKSGKEDILTSLDKVSGITEGGIYPDFDGFASLHAHNKPYVEPVPQGYLQRGVEAHQRGDVDDAIGLYDEVISLLNPEGDVE